MNASIVLQVRRLITLCMIAGAIVSVTSVTAFAQACGGRGGPPPKSSGTKFLLVFMRNEQPGYDPSSTRFQDIILASNDPVNDVTVTITCRAYPNWSKVINLPPNGATTYRISTDPAIGFPNHDALIEVPETVDSTVFKVVSTAPITCYGMNNKELTADAFLALPYDHLSTEYRVMSFFNSNQTGIGVEAMPSEFAVASFDNNNTVRIIPAATTSSGNPKLKEMVFVLDSGECVQIEGDPNDVHGDMTGSTIRSTNPVAVYGGHVRSEAPMDFNFTPPGQGPTTSRDHLAEAIPPFSTWGSSFVARNFGRIDGDVLRVLASVKNTVVKINGIPWGSPFAENEARDTNIAFSNNVPLDNIAAIESNQPILVAMIAHTADATSQVGDPFMAIVPPLDQGYNDFTYFISKDPSYLPDQQFLIIATEQNGVGNIKVDNDIPFPSQAYTALPNSINGKKYSIAMVKQTGGIHRIVSSNGALFTILAFGWGTKISYGYTAGQLLVPHKGIIPINPPAKSAAPTPGDSVKPVIPNIMVRNILTEKIYFDSAKISYDENASHNTVRLKKDIAMETGTIRMAEEQMLELATSAPVTDLISGNVRIWYHTALWTTELMPVDFPFVITPHTNASVHSLTEQPVVLQNYPNPVVGSTTIRYTISQNARGTVKLYDALGRMVKVIMQGMITSSGQEVQLFTKGLIPGEYTLELIVPELGITEHKKMMIVE